MPLQNWEFDDKGLMRKRVMQGNDVAIEELQRKFRWERAERAAVPMAETEFTYDEGAAAFY